jgi:hypothetical protein
MLIAVLIGNWLRMVTPTACSHILTSSSLLPINHNRYRLRNFRRRGIAMFVGRNTSQGHLSRLPTPPFVFQAVPPILLTPAICRLFRKCVSRGLVDTPTFNALSETLPVRGSLSPRKRPSRRSGSASPFRRRVYYVLLRIYRTAKRSSVDPSQYRICW